MISHCRIIQKSTGATVMLVHHTGKTGSSARGSSALPCGVDLAVMATEEENDLIALTTVKARSSKRLPKRQFKRLEVPTGLEDETSCVVVSVPVDVETVPQSEPRRKTHTLDAGERDVLGVLASSVFVETGANANQLNEMLPRYSRSGLYKLIGRLNTAGLIQQSRRGDPFKISEKGKAFFTPQVIPNKMPEGSLTAV